MFIDVFEGAAHESEVFPPRNKLVNTRGVEMPLGVVFLLVN